MSEPRESSEARLDSWKEIAEYLGRNTTTARRWEREEGLPVHRHSHNSRSSVYAFPSEIDAWKASRKTAPVPAPTGTLWRIPTFALAILLCLLMVGNGIRPASAARARQGAAEGISLRQVCAGCDGVVSPDGRYLADSSHPPDLAVLDLSNGQSHTVAHLPQGTRAINPIWSPDSKRIAYYTSDPDAPYTPMPNRQTIVVNRDGSGSRTIYRGGSAYGWSGDGKRILVASQARPEDPVKLAWVSLVDGAMQPLPTALMSLDAASVSPDGRYLAFNATTRASAETNVYLMASDGSGETVIAPNSAYQSPVGWSPDGKHLLYSQYGNSVTLWSVPVANGRAQGSPMAVKDFGNEPRFSDLGVTNGGSLFYRIVTSTSTVYTASMDPATGRTTSSPQLVPTTLATKSVLPRWSPDSTKLLYGGARPGPAANSELHVFSFGTGKDQRVAESVAVGGDGYCWAHDGNSILLNTNVLAPGAPIRNEAVRADLSTSAAKPILPGVNFRMRSCSEPLIAARTGRSVVTRNIETGAQKELYQLDATASPNHGIPVISHNGSSVAFLIPIDAQTTALVTVPTGGGSPREIARAKAPAELQFFYGFCWSPDDRYVYFLKRPDSHSPHELFRVAASGGAEESMGLKAMDIRDLDIAPDGRRIAFSIGAAQRPEIWAMENFLPGK